MSGSSFFFILAAVKSCLWSCKPAVVGYICKCLLDLHPYTTLGHLPNKPLSTWSRESLGLMGNMEWKIWMRIGGSEGEEGKTEKAGQLGKLLQGPIDAPETKKLIVWDLLTLVCSSVTRFAVLALSAGAVCELKELNSDSFFALNLSYLHSCRTNF